MKWRYQPVFTVQNGETVFSVIEVHVQPDGTLWAWTESTAMTPYGETVEELAGDLAHMLADAWKWKPVAYESLRTGMTFDRTGIDVEAMIAAMNAARGAHA